MTALCVKRFEYHATRKGATLEPLCATPNPTAKHYIPTVVLYCCCHHGVSLPFLFRCPAPLGASFVTAEF